MSTVSQTLTPRVNRRKKISLSPVKLRAPQAPPRSKSALTSRTSIFEPISESFHDSGALEFEEFSYWVEGRGFTRPGKQYLNLLLDYLSKEFSVNSVMESGPYLVLTCDVVPEPASRPFTIAGCVAVWLKEGEAMPGELMIGDSGEAADIRLESDITRDLFPYRLPSKATLQAVTQVFESAQYVTFYSTGLVIELIPQTEEAYQESLQRLPAHIQDCFVTLGYHNGPLATTEMMRKSKPNPTLIEGTVDNTDYLTEEERFYPGAMISSSDGNTISAGVLVRNGAQSRLTVAFHCWDHEYETNAQSFGNPDAFKAVQGDADTGTEIGYVKERFQSSDIGLVKLHDGITFQNQFMEFQTNAKALISSESIEMADEFLIDSYVTGRQTLKCLGIRIRKDSSREKDFIVGKGQEHLLPPSGKYINLIQGIYATSEPVIKSPPKIREGVCGSALVRSRKRWGGDVLSEGAIAGFMQFSDLRPKTLDNSQLLCVCEVLDDFIADGWEVDLVER
ncbi:MAG: hypothetical protein Q9185_002715 [Variospora sp. 1 TL-2023]